MKRRKFLQLSGLMALTATAASKISAETLDKIPSAIDEAEDIPEALAENIPFTGSEIRLLIEGIRTTSRIRDPKVGITGFDQAPLGLFIYAKRGSTTAIALITQDDMMNYTYPNLCAKACSDLHRQINNGGYALAKAKPEGGTVPYDGAGS